MTSNQVRVLEQPKNGEKVKPLFSQCEYETRVRKLRDFMNKQNVDAILFTSYENIVYYSNFIYTAFGRRFGFFVTQKETALIAPYIDYGHPWRVGVADRQVAYTDWLEGAQANYWHAVTLQLGECQGKIIGYEGNHLSVVGLNQFKSNVSKHTNFVDISDPVMQMRIIKSQEEINFIKEGAAIADIGGAAAHKALKVGTREDVVSCAATTAMCGAIANRFPQADMKDTFSWCQSAQNCDGAHNPVTGRQLQSGDMVSINCFPMIQGYYSALERTMVLEHCSNAHLKLWEKNLKAHEHGLSLLKVGNKCSDVAKELNAVYEELGLKQYLTFGYGHSMGAMCHYYGREAGVELRESCDTVIKPGMVITMEPSITVPIGQPGAGTFREHDVVVINYDGSSEIVTKFPKGPEHNVVN